eukprot:747862-Hanusia_phi.AAC.5
MVARLSAKSRELVRHWEPGCPWTIYHNASNQSLTVLGSVALSTNSRPGPGNLQVLEGRAATTPSQSASQCEESFVTCPEVVRVDGGRGDNEDVQRVNVRCQSLLRSEFITMLLCSI